MTDINSRLSPHLTLTLTFPTLPFIPHPSFLPLRHPHLPIIARSVCAHVSLCIYACACICLCLSMPVCACVCVHVWSLVSAPPLTQSNLAKLSNYTQYANQKRETV